jgi:L-fuconolactonase
MEMAVYPNVYMKIHGFGEIMPRPFPARDPPFDLAQAPDHIDRAIAAFGAERLMLATDFPPSAAREGYGNVIRYLREYLGRWSAAEQEAILGGTAASVFRFDVP